MATQPRARVIEATLDPSQRQAFKELMTDYNRAAKLHVPGWKRGINPAVAAELVRGGWPKQPKSN
jgi:hypothetical protein